MSSFQEKVTASNFRNMQSKGVAVTTNCNGLKTFTMVRTLQPIPKHEIAPVKTYTCDVCSAQFMSKFNLTNHVFRHIDGVQPPINMCEKCGDVFANDVCLRKHLNVCKGKKIDIAEDSPLRFYKLQRTRKRKNQRRECGICGSYFYNAATLTLHKFAHVGGKPFRCDVCGKDFCNSSNFMHHRNSHTEDKPYQCEICGKCFTNSKGLSGHKNLHKEKTSTPTVGENSSLSNSEATNFVPNSEPGKKPSACMKEKPYICDICGKGFAMCSYLMHHRHRHTLEN